MLHQHFETLQRYNLSDALVFLLSKSEAQLWVSGGDLTSETIAGCQNKFIFLTAEVGIVEIQ